MEEPSSGTPDLGIPGLTGAVVVGRGGFSTVYRCEQPANRRLVAVKMLSSPLADDRSRRAFERECQSLGSLSAHPHIVTLYDSGVSAAGQPYLVMEFVPGGTLADLVRTAGPLAWEDAAAIGVKVSGAAETAHRVGVLHGDIKPENVLLSQYGEPKLADFGVARLVEMTRTLTGRVSVSLVHAAPEVLSGAAPSEVSDVWSLASTVATLMRGRPLFFEEGDATAQALVARILTAPTPDLRGLGVPEAICAVLESALAKDPAQRTATAGAFGEGLRRAQIALGLPPTPMAVVADSDMAWRDAAANSSEAPPSAAGVGPPAAPVGPGDRTMPSPPAAVAGVHPKRTWALLVLPALAVVAAAIWLITTMTSQGGGAQPWPGDSFQGGRIDQARWRVAQSQGASVTEHRGLVIALSPAAPAGTEAVVLTTTCATAADFDVEVSYTLTDWPPSSRGRVALIAGPVVGGLDAGSSTGLVAPQRISEGTGEFYAVNVNQSVYPAVSNSPPGSLAGQMATTDQSGQLLLSRRYETYTSYERHSDTDQWKAIASTPQIVGGPTAFSLQVWVDRPALVGVTLSDFKLAFGTCTS